MGDLFNMGGDPSVCDVDHIAKTALKRIGPVKTTRSYVIKRRLAGFFYERPKRVIWPRVLRALIFVLSAPQRLLDAMNLGVYLVRKRLDGLMVRPHVVVENYAKLPFPPDMRVATTQLALKQLGTASPIFLDGGRELTRQDVVTAYALADKVRGDGKLPHDPRLKPVEAAPAPEDDLATLLKKADEIIEACHAEVPRNESEDGEEDPELP